MIGGAKPGDYIIIRLTTNKVVTAKLAEIKTYGLETLSYNLIANKEVLTFYPFHNIVSVSGEFQ